MASSDFSGPVTWIVRCTCRMLLPGAKAAARVGADFAAKSSVAAEIKHLVSHCQPVGRNEAEIIGGHFRPMF